jgi:FhuF-like iron-sulfur protein
MVGVTTDGVRALGPFFGWESLETGAGWRSWADLGDGDVLAERMAAARRALAAMSGRREAALPEEALPEEALPARVVASVMFLGYAARILSPLLGAAVVDGALPLVGPGRLWWRPVPAGPLPVGCTVVASLPCARLDAGEIAATLSDLAVEGLLGPVVRACRTRFALSPKVLWGNVASALAGAAGMIADTAPAHAGRAAAITARLLDRAPLAGTGTLMRPDPAVARWFLRRRSCCLYYRIPGGGTCGDCVLTAR